MTSCSATCVTGYSCKLKATRDKYCSRHEFINVEIVFTRHGFSCTNAIMAFGTQRDQWTRSQYQDPELTNAAILDLNLKYRVPVPKVDEVWSSTMLRTQETATHLFQKRQVTVVPYIKEMGLGTFENKLSKTPSVQQVILGKGYAERVDLSHVTTHNGRKWTADAHKFNYPKFLRFVARWVRLKSAQSGKRQFRIAVVTHSRVMQEIFGTRDSPMNLAMAIKRFTVGGHDKIQLSPNTPVVKSFDTITSGVPFLGVPLPEEMTYRHIARCKTKVPPYRNLSVI
jgi:broad specificity phosphatase PhoE